MENDSTSQAQIMTYLKHRVMPILQPLQHDIMATKPIDLHEFSYFWLQNFKQEQNKLSDQSSEDEIQDDQVFQQRINRIKSSRKQKTRKGISGQISSMNTVDQFAKSVWTNHQQDKIRMLVKLRNHIFFKNLSQANIQQIIKSTKTQTYSPKQIVYRQGDKGDQIFLVEEGSFISILENKNEPQIRYKPGQSFGELALLYTNTRASTIICEESGKLFSLDRNSFNAILRDDIVKKTKMCEQTLNKNQLFSTMSPYEKCKLIQNLKEISYPAGKYVVKQGQIGDKFYIISEGKLVVEKTQENEIKFVNYLKDGEYFGEIALIRNLPRQASVKTLTSSKLFYIETSTFKRLLGTLQHLLKRSQEKYKTVKLLVKKNLI